jgi:hypothetical protein
MDDDDRIPDAGLAEPGKAYIGPDIVPDMDWVIVCGVKVDRPRHIDRDTWDRFWTFRRWII